VRTSRTDCHFCFPLQSCGRSRTFWPYDFFFSSGSCTRVCVSLIHSVVQILRFAFSVAVPLCSCAQMLLSSGSFSLRVDYGSDPRGSAYISPTPRAAAHFACDESSRYSTVIGLCRTFEETSGRHCRVGRLICQRVRLSAVSTGGVTRRSAPGQLCGLALPTR